MKHCLHTVCLAQPESKVLKYTGMCENIIRWNVSDLENAIPRQLNHLITPMPIHLEIYKSSDS